MSKKVLVFSFIIVFMLQPFTFLGNTSVVFAATHKPITLYRDADFTGNFSELDVGKYNMSTLALGVGNDKATSVRVKPGYKLTLYKDDNQTGTTFVAYGDDDSIWEFNDCTTSVKIETCNPIDGDTVRVWNYWDSATRASLLKQYSPRIYLHSNEDFFPSSIEWNDIYTKRVWNDQVGYIRETNTPMTSSSQIQTYFYGNYSSRTVYAVWSEKDYGNIDFSYWVFYPYNLGKSVAGTRYGNHIGDWEHVTVRLAHIEYNGGHYLRPMEVSYQAHSYVRLYRWSDLTKVYSTHVVAYAAEGSHGMWKDAGQHEYEDLFDGGPALTDSCNAGTCWNTWLDTVQTYQYDLSTQTGKGLGTSTWPSYFNRDYSKSTSNSQYYWGNLKGWEYLGQYRLVTGPMGIEKSTALNDRNLLK